MGLILHVFRRRIDGGRAGIGQLRGRGLHVLHFGVLASLLTTGPAAAQFTLEPDWARRPDADEISRQYPKLAVALAVEGRALMSCDVTATGGLESCVVQEETPKGFGFGAAALRMSRSFEMRPGIGVRRGAPYGAVRIPITFRLPPVEQPPPPKPLSTGGKALAARLVASADPAPGFVAHYEAEAAKLEAPTPGLAPETGAEAAKAMRAAAKAKAPALRQAFGEALAARLSEAELAQFVAFAESDVGRRWFAGDPVLREKHLRLNREQQQRLREEARKVLCRSHDCASAPPAEPVLRPDGPSGRITAADPDAPLPYVPWSQRPTASDTLAAWPISGLFGIAGHAVSACTLGLQGAPEECVLTHESPKGLGVGAAAERLIARYRVAPEFLPPGVGKRVSISAHFPAGPLPRPATTAAPTSTTRFALARRLIELQSQRMEEATDHEALAGLRTRLEPLEPGLRREAEAALLSARDATRPELIDGRAQIIAEAFDEEALRRILRFEEAMGPVLQRAATGSDPELKAISLAVGEAVAAAARESFCKTRDCQAPVFTQPLPPTAASPDPSTRNP